MRGRTKLAIGLAVAIPIGFLALAVGPMFLAVALDPHAGFVCDGDSPEAAAARLIPSARLEQLFLDVRANAPWEAARRYPKSELPEAFQDLEFVSLHAEVPGSIHLHLRGCFDHHVFLEVHGADGTNKYRGEQIVLTYGEFDEAEEVLWTP